MFFCNCYCPLYLFLFNTRSLGFYLGDLGSIGPERKSFKEIILGCKKEIETNSRYTLHIYVILSSISPNLCIQFLFNPNFSCFLTGLGVSWTGFFHLSDVACHATYPQPHLLVFKLKRACSRLVCTKYGFFILKINFLGIKVIFILLRI